MQRVACSNCAYSSSWPLHASSFVGKARMQLLSSPATQNKQLCKVAAPPSAPLVGSAPLAPDDTFQLAEEYAQQLSTPTRHTRTAQEHTQHTRCTKGSPSQQPQPAQHVHQQQQPEQSVQRKDARAGQPKIGVQKVPRVASTKHAVSAGLGHKPQLMPEGSAHAASDARAQPGKQPVEPNHNQQEHSMHSPQHGQSAGTCKRTDAGSRKKPERKLQSQQHKTHLTPHSHTDHNAVDGSLSASAERLPTASTVPKGGSREQASNQRTAMLSLQQLHARAFAKRTAHLPPDEVQELRAIEITHRINQASTLPQLDDILNVHARHFNGINLSAFFVRLSQLSPRTLRSGSNADADADESTQMQGTAGSVSDTTASCSPHSKAARQGAVRITREGHDGAHTESSGLGASSLSGLDASSISMSGELPEEGDGEDGGNAFALQLAADVQGVLDAELDYEGKDICSRSRSRSSGSRDGQSGSSESNSTKILSRCIDSHDTHVGDGEELSTWRSAQ